MALAFSFNLLRNNLKDKKFEQRTYNITPFYLSKKAGQAPP
jgi:hypothetical protein